MERIFDYFPGVEKRVFGSASKGHTKSFRGNVFLSVYTPGITTIRVCVFPGMIEDDPRFVPFCLKSSIKVNNACSPLTNCKSSPLRSALRTAFTWCDTLEATRKAEASSEESSEEEEEDAPAPKAKTPVVAKKRVSPSRPAKAPEKKKAKLSSSEDDDGSEEEEEE